MTTSIYFRFTPQVDEPGEVSWSEDPKYLEEQWRITMKFAIYMLGKERGKNPCVFRDCPLFILYKQLVKR